eukprot:746970-Hanusia_phi.AAC.6
MRAGKGAKVVSVLPSPVHLKTVRIPRGPAEAVVACHVTMSLAAFFCSASLAHVVKLASEPVAKGISMKIPVKPRDPALALTGSKNSTQQVSPKGCGFSNRQLRVGLGVYKKYFIIKSGAETHGYRVPYPRPPRVPLIGLADTGAGCIAIMGPTVQPGRQNSRGLETANRDEDFEV